ncbi:glutathione S-transferase family protein [Sphingomonas crusticola]|uniref:glutathione S-transferase family protein n=1 Tax=Sphingomonas crusticola TaxID=1697973 RepID=UPI000E2891F7|nr:glutathione S-transferase family protein [Sphingomonas crusticola]
MLKLIIGNKAYSSWSLRGWLAVKQSGLPFTEEVVSLYDEAWPARRQQPDLAPSAGKVPLLWDGDVAVWESLAIIDTLADKVGAERFWPADPAARAFARSIASEMHAGFVDLRSECPTNFRKIFPTKAIGAGAQANVDRIVQLWDRALTRFGGHTGNDGGDFLFGEFGAADIMYAPVTTRFTTYSLAVPEFARDYCRRVLAHPFMQEWVDGAHAETWVIEKFEADR